jgi:hypothetical protein
MDIRVNSGLSLEQADGATAAECFGVVGGYPKNEREYQNMATQNMAIIEGRLSAAAGVSEEVAGKAFAQFMLFLDTNGPPEQVGALFAAMPEARDAAASAPEVVPTGMMAKMARRISGGNLFVELGLKLMELGLGISAIRPFGEELLEIGRERAGEPVMGPLVAAMKTDALAALRFGK